MTQLCFYVCEDCFLSSSVVVDLLILLLMLLIREEDRDCVRDVRYRREGVRLGHGSSSPLAQVAHIPLPDHVAPDVGHRRFTTTRVNSCAYLLLLLLSLFFCKLSNFKYPTQLHSVSFNNNSNTTMCMADSSSCCCSVVFYRSASVRLAMRSSTSIEDQFREEQQFNSCLCIVCARPPCCKNHRVPRLL